MPELPDVEVFKRYLDSTALHQSIDDVEVRTASVLEGVSTAKLRKALRSATLEESRRHGKYCFVRLDAEIWLALHFGMTGFLRYYKKDEQEPDHARVLLRLQNGFTLAFVDQRKLGKIHLVSDPAAFVRKKKLGPDALAMDKNDFVQALTRSNSMAKSALMQQQKIAGIGNVYSDEILFQAGIHPKAQVKELNDQQLDDLYAEMRRVLETAIANKADPEKFPEGFIIPRRQQDSDCPGCTGKLKPIKVSGRTGWYCPQCQKK